MRTAIALISIVVLAIGGYFLFTRQAAAPEPAGETPSENAAGGGSMLAEDEIAATVIYSDEGYTPLATTVRVGDVVRFVNQSSRGMWTAVDEHPTHTEYDGTSTREHCLEGGEVAGDVFDMCRQEQTGGSWDYRFMKAGTFGYHNHAQASHVGTITVTE